MPGTVVGTVRVLTHLVFITVLPSRYSNSPTTAREVTQRVSGETGFADCGELGSRCPSDEPFTGVALYLLILCVELTQFWQLARELQNLTINGYSPG